MIVVNASNTAKAWEHIVEQKGGINVRLKDISGDVGLLSVQGPRAEALLQPLTPTHLPDIAYYHFVTGKVAGAECFISRTGYTGEDGFELYCRERDTVKVWEALLGGGAKPIGLGARDSLRTEMGYALYGNEIDENTTPLEAGLGWIVPKPRTRALSVLWATGTLRTNGSSGASPCKLGWIRLQGPRFPPARLSGLPRRARGGPGAERHDEPIARRGDRHDVSARGRRQGRDEVRGRVPGRADSGRGSQPAVLEEGEREFERRDEEDGPMRLSFHWPTVLLAQLVPVSARTAAIASPTADPSEVAAVIRKFKEKDPGLAKVFADAQGYAVFPTVGKGGIGLGAARGKGYVYQRGRLIGRSTLTQVTIGLQLGGQAYSEVVFFKDAASLDSFKRGRLKLDAQASAVALTARASADLAYRNGVAIVTMAKGGLMYEASVGGQKFSYKAIGKTS